MIIATLKVVLVVVVVVQRTKFGADVSNCGSDILKARGKINDINGPRQPKEYGGHWREVHTQRALGGPVVMLACYI